MCFIATIVNAYEAGAVDTALADILAGLSVGELSTLERGRSAYATTGARAVFFVWGRRQCA